MEPCSDGQVFQDVFSLEILTGMYTPSQYWKDGLGCLYKGSGWADTAPILRAVLFPLPFLGWFRISDNCWVTFPALLRAAGRGNCSAIPCPAAFPPAADPRH